MVHPLSASPRGLGCCPPVGLVVVFRDDEGVFALLACGAALGGVKRGVDIEEGNACRRRVNEH